MPILAGAGDSLDHVAVSWYDTKHYAWLLGLAIPALPFLAIGLVRATHISLFWWLGPIFAFGILPPLDTVIGKDSENPPESFIATLERDPYYRWCVYLFLPLQLTALVWACAECSSGALSILDRLGLAITTGVVGAVGINAAHELGH
jgi:alkane 1-monooxygenase